VREGKNVSNPNRSADNKQSTTKLHKTFWKPQQRGVSSMLSKAKPNAGNARNEVPVERGISMLMKNTSAEMRIKKIEDIKLAMLKVYMR
jgi:hypothetical protein